MDAPIAVVLAAGKGTRMKSDLPKVLCEANGRPLVGYVIDALRSAGVDGIVAVVGYQADLVKERLAGRRQNRFCFASRTNLAPVTPSSCAKNNSPNTMARWLSLRAIPP